MFTENMYAIVFANKHNEGDIRSQVRVGREKGNSGMYGISSSHLKYNGSLATVIQTRDMC